MYGCNAENNSGTTEAVAGERDLLHAINPYGKNGLVRAAVEIPAGTNEKWEVDKENGRLKRDTVNGEPRVIDYLAYPWNYGMIPGTKLSTEQGGDGDPLDVIVFGPAATQGEILEVRLIGIMKMLDGGEQDDKLLAVDPERGFESVHSLEDLIEQYPGMIEITTIWLENYKGQDVDVIVKGTEDKAVAMEVLKDAADDYVRKMPGKS